MYDEFLFVVVVPVLVLFGFGTTGRLGHYDLVHIEDRDGGLARVRDAPVLGEEEIVDGLLRHVHDVRVGLDVEAESRFAFLMARIQLRENFSALFN